MRWLGEDSGGLASGRAAVSIFPLCYSAFRCSALGTDLNRVAKVLRTIVLKIVRLVVTGLSCTTTDKVVLQDFALSLELLTSFSKLWHRGGKLADGNWWCGIEEASWPTAVGGPGLRPQIRL